MLMHMRRAGMARFQTGWFGIGLAFNRLLCMGSSPPQPHDVLWLQRGPRRDCLLFGVWRWGSQVGCGERFRGLPASNNRAACSARRMLSRCPHRQRACNTAVP